VSRLTITLDAAYPGIVEECRTAIAAVLPRNTVNVRESARGERMVLVSTYSKQWPCLLPQHGPGKKHERLIELTEWQRRLVDRAPMVLLRGLIHSDGSRSTNTVWASGKRYQYPRYIFSNTSPDIRRLFCESCDRAGIEWRQMNARNISVARRGSVARLDLCVGPKA
jgi:hypothetical protein